MLIEIQDDFDLRKIAESGQCFRAKELEEEKFRFIHLNYVLYIKKVKNDVYEISADEAQWNSIWKNYFALERNYSSLRKNIDPKDLFLNKAAEEGKGIRILRQDPFETLISFIISQRKNIPAIKSAIEKISKALGKQIITPFETLYSFPTLNEFKNSEEALSSCGLGYRLPYILDAVEKLDNKTVDLTALNSKSDEELCKTLKTIQGVGDKVANCTALFAYQRTGIAPIDTWIHQVIEKYYNGQNPFPAYGKDAGIMQQYIFHYAIHHKKEMQ